VKAVERTRKRLIADAKGEREVHWAEIIKKARVPAVHASVVGRSLKAMGKASVAKNPHATTTK
jgi:hypothetical protein